MSEKDLKVSDKDKETIIYEENKVPFPKVVKFYFVDPTKEAELLRFSKSKDFMNFMNSDYPGTRVDLWTVKSQDALMLYVGLDQNGSGWTGVKGLDSILKEMPEVKFLEGYSIIPT